MLGRALVREVVATPELRALQEAVWQAVGAVNPLHTPDSWVPHVSLALNVPADRRPTALSLLEALQPAQGHLVAARTYDSETRTVTSPASAR